MAQVCIFIPVPKLRLGNVPLQPSSAWAPLLLSRYLPRAPGPFFALPGASALGLLARLVPTPFLLRRPELMAQRFTQFAPPLVLAHQAAASTALWAAAGGPGTRARATTIRAVIHNLFTIPSSLPNTANSPGAPRPSAKKRKSEETKKGKTMKKAVGHAPRPGLRTIYP